MSNHSIVRTKHTSQHGILQDQTSPKNQTQPGTPIPATPNTSNLERVSKYGVFNPFVLCQTTKLVNKVVDEISISLPYRRKSHMIIFAPEEMVSLQIINEGSTKYLQARKQASKTKGRKDEKTGSRGTHRPPDRDSRTQGFSPWATARDFLDFEVLRKV